MTENGESEFDHELPANEGNPPEHFEKPQILQAIEIILEDPARIKASTLALCERYQAKYRATKTQEELAEMVAKKVSSNYSYHAAFVGGSTALTGVIPGLGTVLAAFGGATVDTALTMKYQIEMVMSLAVVYGHGIETEEEKRICMLVAGLGAINEAAKQGGKNVSSKAFIALVRQHLRGGTLIAVKHVFKKVGITFTRKAFEKAIPFGVGVLIGGAANKALTVYVGTKARSFFEVT